MPRNVPKALLIVIVFTLASCVKTEKADLIFHNATIISMDEENSQYQAMAVKDGRILALGAEHEIMNRYLADEVVDIKKRVLIPGFIDNHAYFLENGHLLSNYDCRNYDSWESFLLGLKTAHAGNDVFAFGWSDAWFESGFPSLEALDSLFPDQGLFLKHRDGFKALVNTRALEKIGVSPKQSIIEGLVLHQLDSLKDLEILQDIESYFLQSQKECFESGYTASANLGMSLAAYQSLKAFLDTSKRAKIHLSLFLGHQKDAFQYLVDSEDSSKNYHLAGMNLYFLPEDSTSYRLLASRLLLLKERNKQVLIHAFGANTGKDELRLFDAILGDVNDRRWRLENAHLLADSLLHYFEKNTILPAVCPLQKGQFDASGNVSYHAYKKLYAKNKLMLASTAMPLGKNKPLHVVAALVNAGDHALSVIDAMNSLTKWAALGRFQEANMGSLEVGKLANVVVLDNNPLQVAAERLLGLNVLETWVNGEKVFAK